MNVQSTKTQKKVTLKHLQIQNPVNSADNVVAGISFKN